MCSCTAQLVGVRIPDCTFMRRLCQMCGEPLALTSANMSAHTSTVAVHVSKNMREEQMEREMLTDVARGLFPWTQWISMGSSSGGKLSSLIFSLDKCLHDYLLIEFFFSAGVSGALAQTSSGGWRWTNRRPESPRVNSGRPISARQIPHHQTWLVRFDVVTCNWNRTT